MTTRNSESSGSSSMFGRWPRFWKGKSGQLPRYVLCIYFIGRGHRPVLLGHEANTLSQATKETGAFDGKWCLILKFFSEERFSLQKLGAASNQPANVLPVFKTKGIMPWVVQKVCVCVQLQVQIIHQKIPLDRKYMIHNWNITGFDPRYIFQSMVCPTIHVNSTGKGPISTRYFRGVIVSKETLQQHSNARVRNAATLDHGVCNHATEIPSGHLKAKAKSLLHSEMLESKYRVRLRKQQRSMRTPCPGWLLDCAWYVGKLGFYLREFMTLKTKKSLAPWTSFAP